MPKTITETITLDDVTFEGLHIAFPQGAAQPPEITATYKVLRDDGSVHEVKRVGGITLPPGLLTAIKNHWSTLVTEAKAREGV